LVQEQIAMLPEEPILFQAPAAEETEAQAVPEEIPAVQPVVEPVAPVPVGPPLIANLIALAETWPENVRKELVQCNLMDAKVALPVAEIGEGMRQGRIAFTWKRVRSWVKAPALPPTSPEDNTIVELPLKIVAPLYLDRQREGAKAQEKTKIDEEIPNLFFGFPQPEPAADATVPAVPVVPESDHAVARPVDTNYYIWDDTSDSVKVDAAEVAHASPGTKFVARYATPNEVVSRATALAGVAGALIALPDGLMVASQLSSDLNGDTLAAFLPQIFAKVTQCTKELRMGELNNLNFTVGNVPWKIFRVNAIFFAAFGRTGEALPTGQLAALAAELDHKPK
jgi:predicted regulator of Ras-like GTPase activity (Roadblock/LC7/MglB family)